MYTFPTKKGVFQCRSDGTFNSDVFFTVISTVDAVI